MTIELNNNEYTIAPAGYMVSNDLGDHKCSIAVSYNSDSSGLYILGDTFLRNYVSTFDYKKGEVRMAVNVNAPTGTSIVYHMGGWEIFGIFMLCVFGILLIGFCAFKVYKCATAPKK